jgi:hypothetical protein
MSQILATSGVPKPAKLILKQPPDDSPSARYSSNSARQGLREDEVFGKYSCALQQTGTGAVVSRRNRAVIT